MHTFRKFLLSLVLVLFAVASTGAAVSSRVDRTTPNLDEEERWRSFDEWRLPVRAAAAVDGSVIAWANDHYVDGLVTGVDDSELRTLQGVPPFRLVEKLVCDIAMVPPTRPYVRADMPTPTAHIVYVLRDARGDSFEAVVQSFDAARTQFAVISIGPLLDVTRARQDLHVDTRRLPSWSATLSDRDRTTRRLVATSVVRTPPKFVLIPYPVAVNQVFRQYGADAASATYESIHTGERYEGLAAVLDSIDAAIAATQ